MTITAHDIITATTCPTFIEALYQFLRPVEADAQFVYSDTKGIPTLGIGYALIKIKGVSFALLLEQPCHDAHALN